EELADSGQEALVSAELAHHWGAAGRPAHALRWAVRAGDAAAALFAFTEAARHYEKAVGLWPRVRDARRVAGVGHDVVLAGAADANRWLGRLPRGVELVGTALAALGWPADDGPGAAAAGPG